MMESAMISGIHHACVVVSDMQQSLEFYRDMIGLKELMNFKIQGDPVMLDLKGTVPQQHLVMLSAGNSIVELIQYLEPKGVKIHRKTCDFGVSHICFQVPDIEKAYKAMKGKGVVNFHRLPDFISAPCPLHGYGYVYFRGPDDEIVEFIQAP